MAERRADEATRDVMSLLKCEYLQQHLGEQFNGIISAVTGFGFFVELEDLYVEGLVHVSTLNSDYYQFDAAKHRLIGERTGSRYGLGDTVVVQVSNINLEERKVDLVLEASKSGSQDAARMKKSERSGGAKARNSSKKKKDRSTSKSSSKKGPKSTPKTGTKTGTKTSAKSESNGKENRKRKPKAKRTGPAKPAKGKARKDPIAVESNNSKSERPAVKRKPTKLEALKSKVLKKIFNKSEDSDKTDDQPVTIRKRKAKEKG